MRVSRKLAPTALAVIGLLLAIPSGLILVQRGTAEAQETLPTQAVGASVGAGFLVGEANPGPGAVALDASGHLLRLPDVHFEGKPVLAGTHLLLPRSVLDLTTGNASVAPWPANASVQAGFGHWAYASAASTHRGPLNTTGDAIGIGIGAPESAASRTLVRYDLDRHTADALPPLPRDECLTGLPRFPLATALGPVGLTCQGNATQAWVLEGGAAAWTPVPQPLGGVGYAVGEGPLLAPALGGLISVTNDHHVVLLTAVPGAWRDLGPLPTGTRPVLMVLGLQADDDRWVATYITSPVGAESASLFDTDFHTVWGDGAGMHHRVDTHLNAFSAALRQAYPYRGGIAYGGVPNGVLLVPGSIAVALVGQTAVGALALVAAVFWPRMRRNAAMRGRVTCPECGALRQGGTFCTLCGATYPS